MLNNILTTVLKQVDHITIIQDKMDPVSLLLKNLSSNNNWRIKFQNEESKPSQITGNKEKSIQLNLNTLEDNTKPTKSTIRLNIFSNKRSPSFPTQTQKLILNKLRTIPIYTVVNNYNEVIVSSPREDNQQNTLNYFRSLYNDLFFWSHDKGPVSVILFFMNEQDAGSYLHEICKKDPKEAEKLGLSVKITGLDTFYKFNRTSPPKIQSRLIGDLKEVAHILSKGNTFTMNNFNSKQRYSKDWFQGIPIYNFKLINSSNQGVLREYSINEENEKKYIFFREEDAIKAWKLFLERNKYIKLNPNPNLEIYNLENLLSDLEKTDLNKLSNLVLVPPYEASRESTLNKISSLNIEHSSPTRIVYSMKLKFENIQRFYKGLLWLLTSDTLPSEENSW
jgi:hypothetical protein